MKLPPFEDAIAVLAMRMGMSPVELMAEAMKVRLATKSRVLEMTDECIDEQCNKAESEINSCELDDLLKDLK